jgi:hypothetical protein
MPTAQGVEQRRMRAESDPAHPEARPVSACRRHPRIWAVLALGTLGLPAGLQAQSRGDLQVGAHVMMAAPSQLALASALHRAVAGSPRPLAEIRRELKPAALDSAGAALPSRSVITIAFLRN